MSDANVVSEKASWAAVAHEAPRSPARPDSTAVPLAAPPAPVRPEQPPSQLAVAGSVGFYLVAALVMVLGNKAVLNAAPDTPLFFVCSQLVVAVVLFRIGDALGYVRLPGVDRQTCSGIWPLIACNVTGLAFNTLCLALVDASFYQVARGLVLPLTVAFQVVAVPGARIPSGRVLGGIALVCGGFAYGVMSEHRSFEHTSSLGVFLGVLSSCTTAVHAVVLKRSMNAVKTGVLELAYLNNLLSAIALAPIVLLAGEGPAVRDLLGNASGADTFRMFVKGASLTGIFGFLICIAGFISIQVTSPTTHMISSAVRGVIQTYLGVALFGDVLTGGRTMGICLILAGSGVYTWAKAQEAASLRAASAIEPASPPPQYSSVVSSPEKSVAILMDDSKRRVD